MGFYGNMVAIWVFCLITKKWQKLKGLKYHFHAACCLTSDEAYIIIAGFHEYSNIMNKWYVLDIRKDDEYKLKEYNIRVPLDGKYRIVRSGGGIQDGILVVGWIKQQFKCSEFENLSLPPMYMMQLIALWYQNEEMINFVKMKITISS